MKNKSFLIFLFLLFFSSSIFAQNGNEKVEEDKNPFNQPFFEQAAVFAGVTPTIYIVSEDNLSAPSPIVFPVYIGFAWPKDYFISFQPSLKIFTNYYFVNDGKVLPAEIENRTAYTFSFLLNIPVVFKVNLWDKANITASVGIALLIRFGFLASGVDENDYGYSGTAAGDISLINSGFYEGGKFVYMSTSADWMFNMGNGMQLGPEVSFYIPVVTLLSDFSLNGTMISVGIKVVF